MSSLPWFGGEDVDFISKAAGFALINTNSANFDSTYSRGYIIHNTSSNTNRSRSYPFSPGVTDCWVGARIKINSLVTSGRFFGIGKNGTNGGLVVGASASSSSKLALWKADASGTHTELQSESGFSLSSASILKLDMQIESFGASGRVRIYSADTGLTALIDYTGDLTWTGASDLDQFLSYACGGGAFVAISECMIDTVDTRAKRVKTLALTAAGDANTATSGAYTEMDELAVNDADMVSFGATGQVFQGNCTDLPAGTFTVRAVREVARAIKGATGPSQLKLGIKSGGTIDVSETFALATAWGEYDRSMSINPVTGTGFTMSEINALQLALESLT